MQARLDGIHDKRSGALVTVSAQASEPETGRPMWTSRLSYFIRGEGGFGGDGAPSDGWVELETEPDQIVESPTRPDQALLYRLSGDRSPLHTGPGLRRPCRFSRSHPAWALCVRRGPSGARRIGTCRGLSLVRGMYARFSRPVMPGTLLRTGVWRHDSTVRFRTKDADGRTVLDRGRLAFGG